MMVAKLSKVYTKLQGNVDKMNLRLSLYLKLSIVHGKTGKKALSSFCQHFLVHSFPSHFSNPIYRFAHTYYYQIMFGIFFYVHGNIGPKLSFQFPKQGKFLTANIIIENSRPFFFKTKYLLLQKVLINKFLEHDGMRVLSSALFSSCMMVYHDDNPFLKKIFTITEKPAYC